MQFTTKFKIRKYSKTRGFDEFFLIEPFYPFNVGNISESLGTPDMFPEVIGKIIRKLTSLKYLSGSSFERNISVDVSDICDYFDIINVNIKYEKSRNIVKTAKYVPTDISGKKIINIDVFVSSTVFEPNDLSAQLYHELLHAYEDMILQTKYGVSLLDKLSDREYGFWKHIIDCKSKISKETYDFAFLMYSLDPSEIHSKVSEIKSDYLNFIDDVECTNDAIYFFKQTGSYKKMKELEQMIIDLSHFSDKQISKIIDDINLTTTIENFGYKAFREAKNIILQNWIKYQRKFRETSSKIITDLAQKKFKWNYKI